MRSLLKCSRMDPAVGMSLEFSASTILSMRLANSCPVISLPLTSLGLLRLRTNYRQVNTEIMSFEQMCIESLVPAMEQINI